MAWEQIPEIDCKGAAVCLDGAEHPVTMIDTTFEDNVVDSVSKDKCPQAPLSGPLIVMMHGIYCAWVCMRSPAEGGPRPLPKRGTSP